jgi:hypothetical protein
VKTRRFMRAATLRERMHQLCTDAAAAVVGANVDVDMRGIVGDQLGWK